MIDGESIVVLGCVDFFAIDPDANPVIVADGEGVGSCIEYFDLACGISGDIDGLGADVGASATSKVTGKVTPAAFGVGLNGYGEGGGFFLGYVGFKVGCVFFGPIGDGVFSPF